MSAQTENKERPRITLLTQEELESAAEQIAFDLGVTQEKAMEFAKEAQNELYYDRKNLVTRETVATVADAKHLPDEDVPAELIPLDQGTRSFPGEEKIKGLVNFAKKQYGKITSN